MTQTFEVGDRVTMLGKDAGTVKYGPFRSTFDRYEMYVVEDESGEERSYQATDLSARPSFSVGDEVTYEYGDGGKLVAGPFKSRHHDEPTWVVELADGTHMASTQNSLTRVTPADDGKPASSSTYVHAGVTYDLAAKYTDRDGDVWEFTGGWHADGSPIIDCSESGYDSISEALSAYGPLTRVTD